MFKSIKLKCISNSKSQVPGIVARKPWSSNAALCVSQDLNRDNYKEKNATSTTLESFVRTDFMFKYGD
jgi:hypothetical protein